MLSLQKKNDYFLSFHSSIFHSKIHKPPAFKMNRDEHGEQVKNLKPLFEAQKIVCISLLLRLDA